MNWLNPRHHSLVRKALHQAFPVIAVAGLLLAGWALIVTPEELKADQSIASSWKPTQDSGSSAWR